MYNQADLASSLQAIPWFLELNIAQMERLRKICDIRQVNTNDAIFCEGEKEDSLYIVLEGRIAVEILVPTRGQVRIFTAEPLDVFGWSSLTPVVRQRTASARALLPSRLLSFDAEALRHLCDEDHDLGYVIMRRISNVVASRLLTTRLQLLDLFVQPSIENNRIKSILE